MTKKDFIDFAHGFGWTKKDAERALAVVADPQTLKTELAMLRVLARFAGGELADRQRLQAAQKGQVTRKSKLIETLEHDYKRQLEALEKEAHRERSQLVPIIERVYKIAQKFGLNDPWVEALLEMYDDYRAS